MTLAQQTREAFADGGALARADVHFQPRQGQTEMAAAVAQTIAEGGALVVEAGTGVGKTFAYLVPALLSGERVLVSTATKALQDQLFARDLPLLVQTLGLPVRMALLKGRASYLCLHRMEQARQDVVAQDRGVARVLAKVEDWSRATRSGDLAELTGLDDRSPVIPLVTSTRENCLGSQCPRFRECHLHAARRSALAADVVVINHHLFFADLAVRESGMAELLPTVRVVIFDEAHQINETGVQFLGLQLSTGQMADLARDVLACGRLHARGLVDWQAVSAQLEWAARQLRLAVGPDRAGARLRWADTAPDGIDSAAWDAALHGVCASCAVVQESLDSVSELAPDFQRLYERCTELLARAARFSGAASPAQVRWVDAGGQQVRMVESPLDIAESMRSRVLSAPVPAQQDEDDGGWPAPASGPGRAWVFTSATLGTDETLSWFTERAGLQGARVLRVSSPFDYAGQAALYVPRHLPAPADPAHSSALARWIAPAAQKLGGRTLVLTTTLKALRAIGDALKTTLEASHALEILVQGDGPKRRLMERFREGSDHGQPGCILVASATFWEGFDVPGDALQLVVIDKLPFPPPGDPLVEARSTQLERAGQKPFTAYALPEAAVALKQGAGRLIRRETDRGILVVGDTRLVTMGYGKRLMAALPPLARLESEQAFEQALLALTRPSTTDPSCP